MSPEDVLQDGWLTEPKEGWGRVATAVSACVCVSESAISESVLSICGGRLTPMDHSSDANGVGIESSIVRLCMVISIVKGRASSSMRSASPAIAINQRRPLSIVACPGVLE